MLTMTVGETIVPPSGRSSHIRDWIPVAILLVTGMSNGVLYESVVTDEHARVVIAVNFFLSMAAILFCFRKSLPFFRKPPASPRGAGPNSFVFISAYEPEQDKKFTDLSPEEVFNYADTCLN